MDSTTLITIILSIIGGYVLNVANIAVFKNLFHEIYDKSLKKHGIRGLNFRVGIIILATDLPGMLHDCSVPTFSNSEFILSMLCVSSACFAFAMIVRNRPVEAK